MPFSQVQSPAYLVAWSQSDTAVAMQHYGTSCDTKYRVSYECIAQGTGFTRGLCLCPAFYPPPTVSSPLTALLPHPALESRTVSVIIPGKKYGEDADQQISFPVQCSFWALADSTAPSNKTTRTDSTVLGTVVGHSC